MQERADHLDFDIRFEGARDVLARPHRHEYFQIQVGIEGDSRQLIGGAARPFGAGCLSFVLPYRLHVVPHPPGARYAIVNFDQSFLWPELAVEPLDLEEVPIARHPELAPFLFQEYVDFHFEAEDFARILGWLEELSALNREGRFAAGGAIRGILLQLLSLACRRLRRCCASRRRATAATARGAMRCSACCTTCASTWARRCRSTTRPRPRCCRRTTSRTC